MSSQISRVGELNSIASLRALSDNILRIVETFILEEEAKAFYLMKASLVSSIDQLGGNQNCPHFPSGLNERDSEA